MDLSITCADEYFSSRFNSDSWFELSTEEKSAAISTASEIIYKLPFIGVKLAKNQTSPFPRMYKYEVIELPDDVVKSVFEQAFSLIGQADSFCSTLPEEIQSLSLGSASISFGKGQTSVTICKPAAGFLNGWIKRGFDIEPEKFREVY